ncbi:MAG: FadR family transcriptional regulator [Proteobacteria bacterium]|nr:FadR family transcriptional regulator [Pseudomonadota bacterium]
MKEKQLYQAVAEKILRRIEQGVYPPGSRLPGERDLAQEFGVSRITIRGAEIALQSRGLIEIRTGSGVYVLGASLDRQGDLPEVNALEVTEARVLFECEAVALAAARGVDETTLAHLQNQIEIMQRSGPGAEKESDQADREFHLAIAAASENAAVLHVIERLWKMRTELDPVREVYDAVCLRSAEVRAGEHVEILDALRARDPVGARTAMRKHFRRLLNTMLETTEEMALAELRRKSNENRQRFLMSV